MFPNEAVGGRLLTCSRPHFWPTTPPFPPRRQRRRRTINTSSTRLDHSTVERLPLVHAPAYNRQLSSLSPSIPSTMPAKFDPVRDAVLNSPITQSPPQSLSRIDLPHISPTPQTSTSTPASFDRRTVSPINRRATDLASLLNGPSPSEPSLFSPTASGPPRSLSDLLQPSEKLTDARPIHRPHPPRSMTSDDPCQTSSIPNGQFTFSVPQDFPTRPHFSNPPPPTASPVRSPIFSVPSRPSTSSSVNPATPSRLTAKPSPTVSVKCLSIVEDQSLPTPPAATIMPPPPVPQKQLSVSYKPRASSPLVPLTPQEIQFYNDPEKSRRGWFSLSKKRKRSLADQGDSKRSKIAESIMQHCVCFPPFSSEWPDLILHFSTLRRCPPGGRKGYAPRLPNNWPQKLQ